MPCIATIRSKSFLMVGDVSLQHFKEHRSSSYLIDLNNYIKILKNNKSKVKRYVTKSITYKVYLGKHY